MDDQELFDRIQARKRGVKLIHPPRGMEPRLEANKLLDQIDMSGGYNDCLDEPEKVFVDGCKTLLHDPKWEPTEKQIRWLRDLRDKADGI